MWLEFQTGTKTINEEYNTDVNNYIFDYPFSFAYES